MGKYFNFYVFVIWRKKGFMFFLKRKRKLRMNIVFGFFCYLNIWESVCKYKIEIKFQD